MKTSQNSTIIFSLSAGKQMLLPRGLFYFYLEKLLEILINFMTVYMKCRV